MRVGVFNADGATCDVTCVSLSVFVRFKLCGGHWNFNGGWCGFTGATAVLPVYIVLQF